MKHPIPSREHPNRQMESVPLRKVRPPEATIAFTGLGQGVIYNSEKEAREECARAIKTGETTNAYVVKSSWPVFPSDALGYAINLIERELYDAKLKEPILSTLRKIRNSGVTLSDLEE